MPALLHRSHSTPTLQRSSSSSSIDSELNQGCKTRKRFTGFQLMILENLHALHSHPTREQREAAAEEGGMDLKAVTIWFQNKRQAERRTVLRNRTNGSSSSCLSSSTTTDVPPTPASTQPLSRTPSVATLSPSSPPRHAPAPRPSFAASFLTHSHRSIGAASSSRRTVNSVPLPVPSSSHKMRARADPRSFTTNSDSSSAGRREDESLSLLDQIASRAERITLIPVSPKSNRSLWDNMPESPTRSPPPTRVLQSRPRRDVMGHGGGRGLTLEWACENARVRAKREWESLDSDGETTSTVRTATDTQLELSPRKKTKSTVRGTVVSKAVLMARAERLPLKRSRTMGDLTSSSASSSSSPSSSSRSKASRRSARQVALNLQPLPTALLSAAPLATSHTSRSSASSSSSPLLTPPAPIFEATPSPSSSQDLSLGHTPTIVTPKSGLTIRIRGSAPCGSGSTDSTCGPASVGEKKSIAAAGQGRGRADADDEMMQAAWALCGLGAAAHA